MGLCPAQPPLPLPPSPPKKRAGPQSIKADKSICLELPFPENFLNFWQKMCFSKPGNVVAPNNYADPGLFSSRTLSACNCRRRNQGAASSVYISRAIAHKDAAPPDPPFKSACRPPGFTGWFD